MAFRLLAVAAALAGCGRSQGVADKDLGGLVVAPPSKPAAIDVARAAKDPAELGRALATPDHIIAGALGPHALEIATATTVEEAGKMVSQLAENTSLELGAAGAYHGLYNNSAEYGREAIFVDGKLYLRPRYQRWHGRAPETTDEPEQIADSFGEAIGATWDLVAPGAELSDAGTAEVAGRPGRKIVVKLSPSPHKPPAEPLVQRKWRETRSVEALAGEIVLDADKGVPLHAKLDGTIAFSRDGRRFTMKLSLDATISKVGQPAAVTAPAADDVVATPERMREVDDRDFLLQGIAPPLRKKADGTAVAPAPAAPAPATPAPAPATPAPAPATTKGAAK